MRNIIIICTILIAAIITLAGKYFSALSGKDNNTTKALSYIPGDAALILNFKNDESFYEIFKEYTLFDAIIGQKRAEEINQLKELLLKQGSLSQIAAEKSIFLSFHPNADSVDFLYCINLDKKHSTEDLKDAISAMPQLAVKTIQDGLFELKSSVLNRPFYIYLERGVAIASFSSALLKTSVNPKKIHLSKSFINEINKTSNKNLNSPVNLFINHETASGFTKHFIKGALNGNLSLLNYIKGNSSLSMNYKSDAVMFNGISNPDTSAINYLDLFLNQKAASNQIKKVLPDNTSNFLLFGLSDVNKFHTSLKIYLNKRGELKKLEEQIKVLQTKTGVNPDRDVKPLLEKEFAVAENSYGEKFAVIKVSNGSKINSKLQLISTPVNEQISHINFNGLFHYYFGDPLKQFSKPYFSVIDNYLIVANLPGIITNYLSAYQKELFLANTKSFKQYDQLVANQSNIFYFFNTKNSRRVVRNTLKPNYARAFEDDGFKLKNFYGVSYQWTSDGDHFFTNLYITYNFPDSPDTNNLIDTTLMK